MIEQTVRADLQRRRNGKYLFLLENSFLSCPFKDITTELLAYGSD